MFQVVDCKDGSRVWTRVPLAFRIQASWQGGRHPVVGVIDIGLPSRQLLLLQGSPAEHHRPFRVVGVIALGSGVQALSVVQTLVGNQINRNGRTRKPGFDDTNLSSPLTQADLQGTVQLLCLPAVQASLVQRTQIPCVYTYSLQGGRKSANYVAESPCPCKGSDFRTYEESLQSSFIRFCSCPLRIFDPFAISLPRLQLIAIETCSNLFSAISSCSLENPHFSSFACAL